VSSLPGSTSLPASRRRARLVAPLGAIALLLPLLVAFHWHHLGWRDEHRNYPPTPHGYHQIVRTFGRPCSANSHDQHMRWRAHDNGKYYRITFHRKLGGIRTTMVGGEGGRSTNIDNDVYGHIKNEHLDNYVRSGIWGYACRFIAGTSKWSTHAWGIAVDISSRFEPCCNNYHSRVNRHHAWIWKNHRWTWGKSFGDPMHFQYAEDY
jgi:D-alanyl-D-alanine carboxypeptidase-like protein